MYMIRVYVPGFLYLQEDVDLRPAHGLEEEAHDGRVQVLEPRPFTQEPSGVWLIERSGVWGVDSRGSHSNNPPPSQDCPNKPQTRHASTHRGHRKKEATPV